MMDLDLELLATVLNAFQEEHREWVNHNFPGQTQHQALLGVIEEVGELSHAHLKFEQNIRGVNALKYRDDAHDAIGDIIVYLASYCNTNHLSLGEALKMAWGTVRERDWVKYPTDGKTH